MLVLRAIAIELMLAVCLVQLFKSAEGSGHYFTGDKDMKRLRVSLPNFTPPSVGVHDTVANVYLPKTLEKGKKYPLVLMLHGYSGEISEFRNTFGMGLTDIIEVYVNGRKDNKGWRYWSAFGPDWGGACGGWENCGDHDVAYLRRVVETAIDTYNVDVNRVYVLGHSNGAAMALRLACDAADLFSAAVSVEGAPPTEGRVGKDYTCSPSQPVGILQVGGTNDNTVLYKGKKKGKTSYLGSAATVEYFAVKANCNVVKLPKSAHRTRKKGLGFIERINVLYNLKGKETRV